MILYSIWKKRGVSCFIVPRDVKPGMPYASYLMHAIENCSDIILVASDAMNNSNHVLNEVDVIVAKKKTLIPFFIEDFELNDDFRYYLGRTQRIIAYPELSSAYYEKLYDVLFPLLPQKVSLQSSEDEIKNNTSVSANKSTVFQYLPERGIMISPEDNQRNVSFCIFRSCGPLVTVE